MINILTKMAMTTNVSFTFHVVGRESNEQKHFFMIEKYVSFSSLSCTFISKVIVMI